MTEHTEPRRWVGEVPLALARTFGSERVAIREDIATEADLEAARGAIHETLDGTDGAADCELCDELARAALSTIFKEGGEGS